MARHDPLMRSLFDDAVEFHRRRLWQQVPGDGPFLIRVPGEPTPFAATIMGHMGSEYGLHLLRGEQAFADLLELHGSDSDGSAPCGSSPMLAITMTPIAEIRERDRRWLAEAGFQVGHDGLAPLLIAMLPHHAARAPNRSEMKLLLVCYRAVLAAHDRGELTPTSLDHRRRRILELVVEGEGSQATTTARIVRWPNVPPRPRAAALPAFSELPTGLPRLDEERLAAWAPPPPASLPTTLEGWREANAEQIRRWLLDHCDGGLPPDRALARYFGSVEVAHEVLSELARYLPVGGLFEWYFTDYRATARSKTFFERRLAKAGTTEVERRLIAARHDAKLSLFRVEATHPGAKLDVEDVFTGRRTTIHDRGLSGAVREGSFLFLRIVVLGEWPIGFPCSPPITGHAIQQTLGEMARLGLEPTPEALRRAPHLVGRLWESHLERRRVAPQLRNTDDEPLERHRATFRVADAARLEQALRQRKDVEYDDSQALWVWSRPGGPAPGFGSTTLLARLQLLGDELIVDVNSAGRLARARAWIDRLPGVRFERFERAPLPWEEKGPLDDRAETDAPSPPPSLDLRREFAAAFRDHCLRWLDTPLPQLANRTPRAAAALPHYRSTIALLVRTMPSMGIPGGSIAPPRDELLRSLGITASGDAAPDARGAAPPDS